MSDFRTARFARLTAGLLALGGLALGGTACGGSGGSQAGATLPGVVLINFVQSNQDNVPLNRALEFRFSSPIDPTTVNPDSIQVRVGPFFGQGVAGRFVVQGDRVIFEPQIPGLCDLSDSGLKPNSDYRVTLVGNPEVFAIRNLAGDPLAATITLTFHTRSDTDPELFEDQEPGQFPTVVGTSPLDGAYPQAGSPISDPVFVQQGNKVTIDFSENLQPCSVDTSTVLLFQHATGDVNAGFVPTSDQTPGDPTSWGSGNLTSPPTRVRANFKLEQSNIRTRLTLTPVFGEFPDNALLVIELTNGIKDLGNNPLVPYSFAFVTENRPLQTNKKTFEFTNVLGDFVRDDSVSTGDLNSSRSPSKIQGWLLFAGDGDNGTNLVVPSGPENLNNPVACVGPYFQANDSNLDDFDPQVSDVNLNTGTTKNTCRNTTDGSSAVIFEFRTFRIKSGTTVRLTGNNPAIILVSGNVSIEAGGRLLALGDGGNGSPIGSGAVGVSAQNGQDALGGIGVAGGGNGGDSRSNGSAGAYSFNGAPGFGSPDYGVAPGQGGGASTVLVGPGRGAVSMRTEVYPGAAHNRNGPGGGGGGHSVAGMTGGQNGTGTTPFALDNAFIDGAGGGTYGALDGRMPTGEAGSGGGGGGSYRESPWNGTFSAAGGGAGAGGGFVDLTSGGDITIFGEVSAAGGMGGAGAPEFYAGAGGGGGGSGGGIRILTPNNIELGAATRLTSAGGTGGGGGTSTSPYPALLNPGGSGGAGRIVLEDSDSVITGLPSANVSPNPSATTGFYRNIFDPSRFLGGGLRPVVISEIIDVGPASPTYLVPDQDYIGSPVPAPAIPRIDFIAGIPQVSSLGLNRTAIFIEAQGFDANADGTVKLISATGWKTVGYFKDSGNETTPTWVPSAIPGDVSILAGNTGGTIASLNGKTFLQFRMTFYIKQGTGPFDPGAYMDRWDMYFQYNQ